MVATIPIKANKKEMLCDTMSDFILHATVDSCYHGVPQRFQVTKTRQKLHKKICEIDWSHLCLQPCDKFQICSSCKHRKRKWCKSAEINLQKFVKSHQVNLFLAGFSNLEPPCIQSIFTAQMKVQPSNLSFLTFKSYLPNVEVRKTSILFYCTVV